MPTRSAFYAPEELAQRWHVPPEVVEDLIRRGELTALVIAPALVRVPPSAVRVFEWSRRQPWPGPAWVSHTLRRQQRQVAKAAERDERTTRTLPPDDDPDFLTRRDAPEAPDGP